MSNEQTEINAEVLSLSLKYNGEIGLISSVLKYPILLSLFEVWETNSLLEKSDKKTIEFKLNQIKQLISEKYYLTHLTSSFSILESNYNKIFNQSTKW